MLGTFPVSSVPLSSVGIISRTMAGAGAYTVTGQTARFAVGLGGGTGAFTVTGIAAPLRVVMRGDAGAYTVTGYDAVLRYVDNLRLRGRDFSGPEFIVRDTSEGYW